MPENRLLLRLTAGSIVRFAGAPESPLQGEENQEEKEGNKGGHLSGLIDSHRAVRARRSSREVFSKNFRVPSYVSTC